MTHDTLSLFAEDAAGNAHQEAIDAVHHATNAYTASHVVDDMLDRLDWPHPGMRMADPSAGDGSILGQALHRLLVTRCVDDDCIPQMLEGWEFHTFAASQARARLEAIFIANGRRAASAATLAARMVHSRDFLSEGPEHACFDRIAGNPPYLRLANVPAVLREEYLGCVPRFAAADLLHSFAERCNRTLRPGGRMGLVASDRLLLNATAGALREQLGQRFRIAHLERISATSSFYRPKQRRAGTPPRVHPVLLILHEGPGRSLTREPIYPDDDGENYDAYPKLGDIAEVRLAAYLGTAGVFVLSHDQAACSGIDPAELFPAVDRDDVTGIVLGAPKRLVIVTRPDIEPSPAIMAHLKRKMASMAERGLKGRFWMPPEGLHHVDVSQDRLLIPRIVMRPMAVPLPTGVYAINHNLTVVCAKKDLLARVGRSINGPLAARWARARASRIDDYLSLTTNLLRSMPIDLDGDADHEGGK